ALDFYLLVYFVQAGDVAAGANWKGILSSCFAVFSLVLLPLITYIALRYGKIATLIGIYFISALGSLAKWFIYVPGNQAAVVIDALLGASSFVAIAAILPTMLADLSAKTKQQSGYGYQGYFVAAQNKFVNFSIVGAMLGTGVLLNIIGFDARLGELQSEQSLFWMRICLAGGTFCLNGVSLLILLKYPFTDKQQIMR
ncbi:MFS transporter, partial [Paraglaciecola sp.]|uniref:MFS transporter n=1 Tax=Paraglaciecola sp. TaxID=1920173 RepID=UPI00273FA6BC